MTTINEAVARCSVCGAVNQYMAIGSTNAMGSSDLDTRPPEMARSTICDQVRRCSSCGYCADDLESASPGVRAVVDSQEYRIQLTDPTYPELANSFLCAAIINRDSQQFADAVWPLIRAAWVCDDNDMAAQAKTCRLKAANMIALAEEHGQSVVEQEGGGTALLVDLLRRSGQIAQAKQVLTTRRTPDIEGIIASILDFQAVLLDRGDTACHTVDEAMGETP